MVSNSNSMLSMRIIFSTWYFSSEATASNMASRTCAKMSSFCVGAAHRASSERVSAPPPSLVVLCWWRSCFAPLFQLQRRRRGRLLFVRVCMRRRSCPQGTVVLHKTEQSRTGQDRRREQVWSPCLPPQQRNLLPCTTYFQIVLLLLSFCAWWLQTLSGPRGHQEEQVWVYILSARVRVYLLFRTTTALTRDLASGNLLLS